MVLLKVMVWKLSAWKKPAPLRSSSRRAFSVLMLAVWIVTSTDEAIVLRALDDERVVLTQDLRFSAILGRAGQRAPSLISLRLSSSRIEFVNAILERVLPRVERDVAAGAIVTVEDSRIRTRRLPIP